MLKNSINDINLLKPNLNHRKFFNLPDLPSKKEFNKRDSVFLDNLEKLKVFDLYFTFNNANFALCEEALDPKNVILSAYNILDSFNLVNKKGFVPKKDPNPLIPIVYEFLRRKGYKFKDFCFGANENTYRLWYNFFIFNILLLILLTLKSLEEVKGVSSDDEDEETILILQNLKSEMLSRLDPFLKIQIQKRGISILQNNYVGFDTEFELMDFNKQTNKLISVQTALRTRTIVKVPLYSLKDISYVHPLTSEITTNFKPKIENWDVTSKKEEDQGEKLNEMEILNSSLKSCVSRIRKILCSPLEQINEQIIFQLKKVSGVSYYEDQKRDQIVFSLPLSELKTNIFYPNKFTFKELVALTNADSEGSQTLVFNDILQSFLGFNFDLKKLSQWHKSSVGKGRTRTSFFLEGVKISLNLIRNNYFCAHYNSADLSMFEDFEDLKLKLDIINKSFVTIGRPLRFGCSNIYIRDTMLLAPAGLSSLKSLGELYTKEGDFNKIELSREELENMSTLLAKDKVKFEQYALRDAIITLKHALAMEEFNFSIKQLGVPLTLSSLGRNFVFEEWRNQEKFMPYQISGNCLMGNSDEVQTPKGLFYTGDVGLHMSYFVGNYKGGRNESFMYGAEDKITWFDYDLVSAYTSGMSHLSFPHYPAATLVNPDEIEKWSEEDLLKGYIILNGTFKFPDNTKYPSIPCYIDKTTTVYPLFGTCLLTGPEYILAKNQGCSINIISAFYIPPVKKVTKVGEIRLKTINKPFYEIIKKIQEKRREHPKGHILNLLYKEMGNSIYGNVVRGISNKKGFDTKSGKMLRMPASEISNPILASWITAFIRSVIGECLHNIHKLGGKVVSVTTDGFITDLPNLESKLLSLKEKEIPLFLQYRKLRLELSGKAESLEIKHSGKGIISWTTRGQWGVESGIRATTGFQSSGLDHSSVTSFFKKCLSSDNKMFEFTQKRLRGAKDIFTKGGHVTQTLRNQTFRMFYDNRRQIIETEASLGFDMSCSLLDSSPVESKKESLRLRFLSKLPFSLPYQVGTSKSQNSKYRSYLDVAVRNFIKGYLAKEPCFGLSGNEFKSYKELMSFIYGFESAKDIKLSKQSISNLKHRKIIFKPVLKTVETLTFTAYLKNKIPNFRDDLFI